MVGVGGEGVYISTNDGSVEYIATVSFDYRPIV